MIGSRKMKKDEVKRPSIPTLNCFRRSEDQESEEWEGSVVSRTNEGKKLQHKYEISGYVGQTKDLQGWGKKQHHKIPYKNNQNQRGNGFLNSKTRSQNTRKQSCQRSPGKQPAKTGAERSPPSQTVYWVQRWETSGEADLTKHPPLLFFLSVSRQRHSVLY